MIQHNEEKRRASTTPVHEASFSEQPTRVSVVGGAQPELSLLEQTVL